MKPQAKVYSNGWSASLDKGRTLYEVTCRNASGDVHDRMRCDDYRSAREFFAAFKCIARAA